MAQSEMQEKEEGKAAEFLEEAKLAPDVPRPPSSNTRSTAQPSFARSTGRPCSAQAGSGIVPEIQVISDQPGSEAMPQAPSLPVSLSLMPVNATPEISPIASPSAHLLQTQPVTKPGKKHDKERETFGKRWYYFENAQPAAL